MRNLVLKVLALAVLAGGYAPGVWAAVSSDLSVSTPTTSTSPIVAGANIVYTFNAINNTTTSPGNSGPAGTIQVTINMPVTAGASTAGFVSLTAPTGWTFTAPAAGSTTAIVVTNSTAALVNGAPVTFTLTAKIASGATGTITDAVSIAYTSASGNTDSNALNNNATSASSTITTSADMQIVSFTGPATYNAGGSRTCTLVITNAGPSDAPGINYFTMPLATNMTVSNVSASGTPALSASFTPPATTAFQCNFTNTWTAGSTATVTWTETITSNTTAGTTYTDVVTLNQTTITPDPNPNNNAAGLAATITTSCNLSVTYGTPTGVTAGSSRIIPITVTNAGPSDAASVVLTQNPSSVCTFTSFINNTGGIWTPAGSPTNQFKIATLAAGTTATFTFTETINSTATGTVSDSATIATATTNTSSNQTATISQTITVSTDVAVLISGPTGTAAIGSNLTYTVTVSNSGPSAATNVVLTDSFSVTNTNLVFVSQSQLANAAPTFTLAVVSNNISDTIASLPPTTAGAAIFTIVAQIKQSVASGSTVSNAVSVSSSSPDSNPNNNNATSGTVTTNVNSDISIAITTNPPGQTAQGTGGNITYVIAITNNGPTNATGVTLSTATTSNMTYVSNSSAPSVITLTTPAVGASGSITTAAGFGLTAGSTETISLVLQVPASVPVGTNLQITASTTSTSLDGNSANNSATSSAVMAIVSADVAITNLVSTPATTITPPGNIVYTFNVVNNGPSNAIGVVFSDTLPTGITFSSLTANASPVTPVLNGSALSYTIGTMTPNQSIAFVLTVAVASNALQSTFVNSLSVASTTTDSNTANNTATVTVNNNALADLAITVSPSENPVIAGNPVAYTIVVTNNGPSDGQNVLMTFPLPGNSTLASIFLPNGWTQTSVNSVGDTTGTFTATIPALAANSTGVFVITFSIDPAATLALTNTATVAGSTTDTVSTNNSVTTTVTINPQPTVSINNITVPEGNVGTSTATFTVTLSAPNTQSVGVDFITMDGTAFSPGDYTALAGTVFFNPGETSKPVGITLIGNTLVQPDRTFTVLLQNPVNTTITSANGVCTIQNDDFGGALQFQFANYTANENAGSASITVTRTGGLASATTVQYSTTDGTATANIDYTSASGTVTFGAGVTSTTFAIPLLNKYGAINDATVNLMLSNPYSGPVTVPGASATLGAQTTAVLTILAAPAFTSPLAVSSQIGTQFTYGLVATGEPTLSYSLPNPNALPPGLTFSAGFITGNSTQIGTYSVPIRADNAVGFDLQTLVITITPVPNTGSSNTLLDSDGDGVPDEIEIAAGTNPYDSTSTPLGAPLAPGQVKSMSNLKLAISLNFAKQGTDSLTLSGGLLLPSNFNPSGKLVYFDIGGVVRRFALDETGASRIGSDTVKFKIGKGAPGTTSLATFNLTIKDAAAAPLLTDEGLINATLTKVPVTVPVVVLFDVSLYTVVQNQVYTARLNKTGKSTTP